MKYEGPSQEDLDRFGQARTGYCPHCGEEVWDDVEKCPHCGRWMMEGASHRPPMERELNRKMVMIIVIITLLAFLGVFGWLRIF